MSPQPRLVRLALLWLLLALLPLRAWAGVAMHLPEAGSAAPCHAEAMASVGSESDNASADGTPCSLCSVCHGGALPATAKATLAAERGAQALPAAHPGAAPRREPDALFRPPRI